MPTPALSLPQQPLTNTPFARSFSDSLVSSWWRLLDVRRPTAGPAAGGERRAFEHRAFETLSRRLQRMANRGRAVTLGNLEQSYVPRIVDGVSAASVLRAHEGLAVKIVTSSPQLLEELDLWRDLDQHHAVVVEIPIAVGRSAVLNGQQCERLELARRVAEVGIEVRLQLCCDAELAPSQLRQLFEEAVSCRVSDILLPRDKDSFPESLDLLFRQLRLQFDLPRVVVGHT